MEVDWPVVDLNTNTIGWGETAIRVTPRSAELLSVLIEGGIAYTSSSFLLRRVWGETVDRLRDPLGNLQTQMHTLRRALQPIGFTIDVQYGEGWRLTRFADVTNNSVKRSVARATAKA